MKTIEKLKNHETNKLINNKCIFNYAQSFRSIPIYIFFLSKPKTCKKSFFPSKSLFLRMEITIC